MHPDRLFDYGLECSLVAQCLLEPARIPLVAPVVQPEMMGDQFWRRAYHATLRLYGKGHPIEWSTVAREMLALEYEETQTEPQPHALEHAQAKLHEAAYAAAAAQSDSFVQHVAGDLRELWVGRRLSTFSDGIARAFANPAAKTTEVLDKIERAVAEMRGQAGQSRLRTLAEDVARVVRDHAARKQLIMTGGANASLLPGLSSGFADLDLYTTGWKAGELIVIGARPGQGKTSLALNIAENVALSSGEGGGALLFSLEMTGRELAFRLACARAGVDSQAAKLGKLNDEDELKLEEAAEQVKQLPLYVDDTPGLSMRDIRAKAAVAVQRLGVTVVLVDYLQRIRKLSFKTPRWEHVGDCAKALKTLARELPVPVVALAQLNRQLKQRRGKAATPQLEDLRESGDIEQEADAVYLLHTVGPYAPAGSTPEPLERARCVVMQLDVAKNRGGPSGSISFLFQRWCGRWQPYTEEQRHDWSKADKPLEERRDWQDGSKARAEA